MTKASVVCPDSVRPLLSTIVPDTCTWKIEVHDPTHNNIDSVYIEYHLFVLSAHFDTLIVV